MDQSSPAHDGTDCCECRGRENVLSLRILSIQAENELRHLEDAVRIKSQQEYTLTTFHYARAIAINKQLWKEQYKHDKAVRSEREAQQVE